MLGGRYQLIERIAAGGQGEVWRAEDATLGRTAAVKVLRAEFADHVEFRERFRREAQHAASLSHPGIAQVFDYDEGDDGTAPYLVMEYVDGESLSDTIAREAPLSSDRVLDIVIAAASALSAAHAAGLVHRDVKPGNLLLSRDGSVKITDFGIARAVDASPLTRSGLLIGTPLYLAPEQATGQTATSASDLYALGIIVFEMLTGAPPYEGPATAVLLAHRDTPLPPLPPSVPAEVADLVRALTAKDPAARPQPAAAVADWAARLKSDPAATAPGGAEAPASSITPLDQPAVPVLPVANRPGNVTRILARPPEPDQPRRKPILLLTGVAAALTVALGGWLALPDGGTADGAQPSASPSSSARAHRSPVKQPEPASRVAIREPDHRGPGKHGHGGKDTGSGKHHGLAKHGP